MSTSTFAKGWQPDLADERDLDYPPERLLGHRVGSTPFPASVMQYRKGKLVQGQAGSCVAHALTRGIDICLRHQLAVAGKTVEPPKAARGFIYYNGRRQETVDARAEGQPDVQVTDSGIMPRLGMRAVQKVGYCEESDYPYSDSPAYINAKPPPRAYHAAYDQKDFTYSRITSTGTQRIAEVAAALAAGFGVIFGTFVDMPFERWDPSTGPIDSIDENDPDGGGHMLCVLAVETDGKGGYNIVFDNWWDESWGIPTGEGGIGKFTARFFGDPSSPVSDIYIIKAVPTFAADPKEATS